MKIKKNTLLIVGSIFIVLFISKKIEFDYNENVIGIISTFISISIGFTITALSIIATSSFSKELYRIEDENDNSKTLLHNLINQFKIATLIFLLTQLFILLFNIYPKDSKGLDFNFGFDFNTLNILNSCIWYSTFVSILIFYKLFNTFSKFVIKTSSN